MHDSALQRRNTLWVTSKAAYEGRATEQCGLTPTPSAYTALSLEQAPLGNLSNPCHRDLVLRDRRSRSRAPRIGCIVWLPREPAATAYSRLRRVPPIQAMHDACLVPCVIGLCPIGREGPLGCVVLDRIYRLPCLAASVHVSRLYTSSMHAASQHFVTTSLIALIPAWTPRTSLLQQAVCMLGMRLHISPLYVQDRSAHRTLLCLSHYRSPRPRTFALIPQSGRWAGAQSQAVCTVIWMHPGCGT